MKIKYVYLRNLLFVFLVLIGVNSDLICQKTALIIIDVQEFYFPGGDLPLVNPEKAANNAALLLKKFRESKQLVVHVKHNYEPGGSIDSIVKPIKNEIIISKDHANAFIGTGLDSILRAHSIKNLVLCGMQTHMCLEAATRAAADMGYTCTVIEDACATRNLKYGDEVVKARDVHLVTLATLMAYATISTTKEYLGKQ